MIGRACFFFVRFLSNYRAGVAGLSAWHAGAASVLLTDIAALVPLLTSNAERARRDVAAAAAAGAECPTGALDVAEFEWCGSACLHVRQWALD